MSVLGKASLISTVATGSAREQTARLPSVRATLLTVDAITSPLIAEWARVAARMAQPNVFAEPWMMIPALMHCSAGQPPQLLVVRDAADNLIGVMPVDNGTHLGRVPMALARCWGHPNAFVAAICIAAGHEQAFWHAAILALGSRGSATALLVAGLVADGTIAGGLVSAAAVLDLPTVCEDRTVRAMLATKLSPEQYWTGAVRPKKRKELRRQWARLAECGALTTDHIDPSSDAAPWIKEFLALEHSGWKGRSGSALSSNPGTKRFFTEAVAGAHMAGRLNMMALRLDGRPIAMLVTLTGVSLGGCEAGYSFKTAYDEAFARYSPGVLLQREGVSLLAQRGLHWIDSCAAQDHPMIDSLWRERRTIETLSVPLPGLRNHVTYAAIQAAKRGWHAVRRRGQQLPKPLAHVVST